MTNSNKDLKSFIESQIEKTGFPTELEVMERIGSKGWEYVPSSIYCDYDENIWREIDTIAFDCLKLVAGEALYRVCADLVLDCKKSTDHAWVFVVPPRKDEEDWRRLFNIDFFEPIRVAKQAFMPVLNSLPSKNQPWLDSELVRKELSNFMLPEKVSNLKDFQDLGLIQKENFQYFMEGRIGLYGKEIRISENEKKSRSQIFESLLTVNKALSYTARIDAGRVPSQITSLSHPKSKEDFLATIEILIPLIVFDGALYSWEKQEGVIEQKQILARSVYRSEHYNWSRLVPIVNIDYLPVFLDYLNRDLDRIHESIIREFKKCDIQIQNLTKAVS
jgi:hypothetical protein